MVDDSVCECAFECQSPCDNLFSATRRARAVWTISLHRFTPSGFEACSAQSLLPGTPSLDMPHDSIWRCCCVRHGTHMTHKDLVTAHGRLAFCNPVSFCPLLLRPTLSCAGDPPSSNTAGDNSTATPSLGAQCAFAGSFCIHALGLLHYLQHIVSQLTHCVHAIPLFGVLGDNPRRQSPRRQVDGRTPVANESPPVQSRRRTSGAKWQGP